MKTVAILLVVASSLLVSCECGVQCCADVQIDLKVWVHDSNGNNMISTAPGHFHPDSIRLFTFEDGHLTSPVVDLKDNEWNFRIDTLQSTGQLFVSVAPEVENADFPQTSSKVIRWSYADMDTIDFEVGQKCNQTRLNSVWYNGELTYDRPIEVAK